MATNLKEGAVAFDRRQVYRPFLDRLNPIASSQNLSADGLIVAPSHDPRDTGQPPIHVAFANTAELTRGSPMALGWRHRICKDNRIAAAAEGPQPPLRCNKRVRGSRGLHGPQRNRCRGDS